MDDAKTQLRFKGVKVPIAVEQRVVANQAERRDEAINGLAHRQTARPQVSIVVSRGEGEGDGARLEYFEVPEVPEHATCLRFGADALKHFAEDQVRQAPDAGVSTLDPATRSRAWWYRSSSRPRPSCR